MSFVKIDEIRSEALRLPPEARVRLAEELLASLQAPEDEDGVRLWAQAALERKRSVACRGLDVADPLPRS